VSAPLAFSWNGEPIPDIHAWAAERGEEMVRVRKTWHEPLPLAGEIMEREEILEMPGIFFRTLRFGGPMNESYVLLEES
jgi:hypothetical protein